ncbi:MAG: NAD-dependent epimerase/dehydratase family protein [Anaerolineales bacterium]|nr:NAD-dependent epimerase/dehydratase family protein [Anaerolineales bacterium]
MVARVLVTGGTGFIGQHLVPALLAAGHRPVLLLRETYAGDRLLPPILQALRPELELVYADLRNFNLTSRAVRQAQATHVLHLAAAGATDPFLPLDSAIRHNLYGTIHLLRACFETARTDQPAIQQLLLCRTPGELTTMNVYATSKLAAWNFCQMYAHTRGWPIIGAMIFQTYGIGQRPEAVVPAAFQAALAGADFPMTSGEQQRDWIYVGNVVTALLQALFTTLPPGSSFDVGSGQPRSVLEVVSKIYELVNSTGRPRPGLLPTRPGEVTVQCADVARTRELTGWEPTISLTAGLCQMYSDLQQQSAASPP